MTAGGPGDHWLTDVLHWDLPAFGEPIDSLIRDIIRFGGQKELEEGKPIARSLNKLWWPPHREASGGAELQELSLTLLNLRDRLRKEAIDGGREVT